MTAAKQNRLIIWMQAIFFPVFTAGIIATCWWQVKIYRTLTLQPTVDAAQDARINQLQITATSLIDLAGKLQETNYQQDKDIIKLQGEVKRYKFNP